MGCAGNIKTDGRVKRVFLRARRGSGGVASVNLRKGAFLAATLVMLGAFLLSCGRPAWKGKLQSVGGGAKLQAECAPFVQMWKDSKENKDTWMPSDTNFPPAISSFQPQMVSVERHGDVTLVNVQVSGGFNHMGLLVAPSPAPAGFKPHRSNWSIWELAPGVWEYRE
jgi:hypothetical protein